MEIFKNVNIDWIGKRWMFIGVSLVVIGAGAVSLITKGGPALGIDFTGGTLVRVQFQQPVSLDAVRDALRAASLDASEVTTFDDPSKNIVQIRMEYRASDETAQLEKGGEIVGAALRAKLGEGLTVIGSESMGPKVGGEMQNRARNAILLSSLGMLVYIAFRFSRFIYGLAAVIAMIHDVFIAVGFLSLFDKPISLTVVAALLTLVGYSVNDTIVIFDRVRENLRLTRRRDLRTILNLSVNQTLSRSIITNGMTFLAVLALWLFGGEVLNAFSFVLVVGIIVGSYSTVAIASPLVLWWDNFFSAKKG
ncbi:MAG: protein translocase subunit SecF [Acidobacteriota bacterium]